MPNSPDFRSDQIQVNKLIVSGANAGSAECLLIYPLSAQGIPANQGNIDPAVFDTSPIGSDAFFYVSGSMGGKGGSTPTIAVFGGDLHVSGNLSVDGSGAGGGVAVWFSNVSGSAFTTGSVHIQNEILSELSLVVSGSSILGGINCIVSAINNAVAHGDSAAANGIFSHAEGHFGIASGDYSHTEGFNTFGVGSYSHAEGQVATASGYASHAEGSMTTASGVNSHAEGYSTTASGMNSHAEGSTTIASDDAAHAEGSMTTASGKKSHAEGDGTTALGDASHAEGNFALASGYGSHAEGYFTTASINYAHAEGNGSVASGYASHAEGYFTVAQGESSHAEGWGSEAFGTGSLAVGLFTVASGAVDGISFPPTTTQAAFGKYNLRDNVDSLFVIGDGLDDSNRHDVLRVNSGSVQVTGSLIAPTITGSIEYIDEANTIPFLINGANITANYNSLGQWEITGSGGVNFWTELDSTNIYTTSSVRVAGLSASLGAEITGSVTQGAAGNVASGMNSHAEGSMTTASGDASHAEGNFALASGNYAHAEGNFVLASGYCAHAEGNGSVAAGSFSHAEGSNTWAIGEFSHASGIETFAYGTGSFATGLGTVASGAIDGVYPTTTTQASFGKYNLRDNVDSLFVVGDGLDDSNRHDVFRVNSGSVQVTGSLEVLGGITGSLSGTFDGNPFLVAGPGITTAYNPSGQWELSASTKTPILAGVVTTTLSASTVAGYVFFTDFGFPSYTLEGIGFSSVAGVTGSLELYDLNNSSSLSSISWTETTPTHKTASFVATGSSRVFELRVNKDGGSGSDYSLFSAVFFG